MTPTTETPPRRAVWAFLRHLAALALLLWLTFGLCFGLLRVPDTAMVPSWLNVTFALGDAIKPNVLSSVYL